MATNYLPRLKPGHDDRLVSPNPGTWSDEQAKRRLDVLASAIENNSRTTKVHSIPDPWLRVILFARALFEPTHPKHLEILGEWRGLLAIIGLKHIRGFQELAAEPISLDEPVANSSFLATVARVRPHPKHALVQGANWDNFHILRWHGQSSRGLPRAFGMTTPTTLVATGSDYSHVFTSEEVPWFVNGLLVDPVTPLPDAEEAPGNLSGQERESLAQWVLHLRAELLKQNHGDQVRHARVIEQLQEYAEALKPNAQPAKPEALEPNGLNLHEPELYRLLTASSRRRSATLTDLRIADTKASDKVYVLYDPDLTRHFKPARKERDITFFETDTLSSAPRVWKADQGRSGLLRRESSGQEILWCNASFFFQDDLIYDQVDAGPNEQSSYGNTFPGCRPVTTRGRAENRNIVLPLSEDAARLFSPDYLEANFSIEWLMGGGAKCSLKLRVTPLAEGSTRDAGGPATEITLEHTYQQRDMHKISMLPVICVWPNFEFRSPSLSQQSGVGASRTNAYNDRWKRYFLFETWPNTSRAEELVATPLDAPDELRSVMQPSGVFQIATTTRFPHVLVCRMPFSANKPRTNDNSPPKGVLLLKPPVDPSDGHSNGTGTGAALGIDFGTTGTTIYSARIDGTDNIDHIEPVRFQDRVVQVTARAEDELKDLTRHHFIPSRIDTSGKMLSVFQTHGTDGGTAPLLDGHALFQDSNTKAPAPFVWGEPGTIVMNLKWGSDQRENAAAEAFLAQLCLQSVAEQVAGGASSVDIRYSYPTAFSGPDIDRVRRIWEDVITKVQAVTSVPITANKSDTSNYEAVAATRYFKREMDMSISQGALTLDIGGGTTDLALWNMVNDAPALIAHSSVLFAGRDMFQAVLRRDLNLLKEIDPRLVLPRLQGDKFSVASDAELDALISQHGDELLQRLPHATLVSERVREFIAILELGMSGIGFYTGLLLGHLIANKTYDVSEADGIQAFVGGNAARLLNWCDLGRFRQGSTFYERFCGSILAGGQVGAPDALEGKFIRAKISDHPKEEVAYGLVAKFEGIEKMKDYSNPIAGEDFRIGPDQLHSWSESPDLKAVLSGGLRVKRDLPVFNRFLETVGERLTGNEQETLSGSVNDSLLQMKTALQRQMDDPKFNRLRSSGEQFNPGRKQPLFILALKKLLDLRINSLVKHG